MGKKSFICENCKAKVPSLAIGTKNRNHCPFCLWSKHVDENLPGDRKSHCLGMMRPIGVDFKKEKKDKYGQEAKGEIMLAHQCQKCGKESNNRIAGDDNPEAILAVGEEINKKEVKRQLFGK